MLSGVYGISYFKFQALFAVVLLLAICAAFKIHDLAEGQASPAAREDTFVLSDFKTEEALKARADQIVALCQKNFDCVDNILRRDNPNVSYIDSGKAKEPSKSIIAAGYHVDGTVRTTSFPFFSSRTFMFGANADPHTKKITQYDTRIGTGKNSL